MEIYWVYETLRSFLLYLLQKKNIKHNFLLITHIDIYLRIIVIITIIYMIHGGA
jgi:hypothetical protein